MVDSLSRSAHRDCNWRQQEPSRLFLSDAMVVAICRPRFSSCSRKHVSASTASFPSVQLKSCCESYLACHGSLWLFIARFNAFSKDLPYLPYIHQILRTASKLRTSSFMEVKVQHLLPLAVKRIWGFMCLTVGILYLAPASFTSICCRTQMLILSQ